MINSLEGLKRGDRVKLVSNPMGAQRIGDVGTVVLISPRTVEVLYDRLRDLGAYIEFPEDIEPVAAKPQPIKSLKVSRTAIEQALTAYVKDTLGIDATVTKIIGAFTDAVELELGDA